MDADCASQVNVDDLLLGFCSADCHSRSRQTRQMEPSTHSECVFWEGEAAWVGVRLRLLAYRKDLLGWVLCHIILLGATTGVAQFVK